MNGHPRAASGGLLDAIRASVRTALAWRQSQVPLEDVRRAAEARVPNGARFRAALGRGDRLNAIAECKRRSPARGVLADVYDPAAIARGYERAGAAAVSVLTEPSFFDGSLAHLEAVRAAVSLPLLRKDFVLDEYQIHEARAAGADAVLLIVAMLDEAALGGLMRCADDAGLAALVEVHTRPELHAAIEAGAGIIGVNSRDLRTLAVDLRVCEELAADAPEGVVLVAESGVRSRDDLDRLASAGYRACLIGERLMTSPDPGAALAGLLGRSSALPPGASPERCS